jgi:hypothetical protein
MFLPFCHTEFPGANILTPQRSQRSFVSRKMQTGVAALGSMLQG